MRSSSSTCTHTFQGWWISCGARLRGCVDAWVRAADLGHLLTDNNILVRRSSESQYWLGTETNCLLDGREERYRCQLAPVYIRVGEGKGKKGNHAKEGLLVAGRGQLRFPWEKCSSFVTCNQSINLMEAPSRRQRVATPAQPMQPMQPMQAAAAQSPGRPAPPCLRCLAHALNPLDSPKSPCPSVPRPGGHSAVPQWCLSCHSVPT